MIHSVMIFNAAGKPRLTKFFVPHPPQDRLAQVQRIYELLSSRPDSLCNFVELPMADFDASYGTANSTSGKGKGRMMPVDEDEQQQQLARNADFQGDVLRVIYRHYATLYFVFCVDEAESELGILDLIQVFVESLDRCFENVCELDLIFNFDSVHTLLNCMIVGGFVQDTNIDTIASLFRSIMASRKASVQSDSITGGLPELSLGAIGGGSGSWTDRLTRGLGRGRLGR